ncbi:MAG TPA: lipopolysaccharide biosynthesis protein RfbH [Candidatus Thermoplasmatota archaeon]|nr:lipopolysaccharide biosynthesis protein RfbH [Candidatus Thermoplasmatota archaeon]
MKDILDQVQKYMDEKMAPRPFKPGVTAVPYSGTVATGDEYRAMTEAILSGWFGLGAATPAFEKGIAERFGRKKGVFVNSGSSANLVAVATLFSRLLPDHLQRGDEVVTCVSGFPTTVNPLITYGASIKWVDTSLPTYNPTGDMLVEAVSHKTKALVFAHTLGNPYDMKVVSDLVRDYDLWLMEDCCDALGSTYGGKPAGSFGDVTTCSFYPAHHITTGEGGMVCGDNARLMKVAESIRDWGRDCWCAPGVDNTCGKRFGWKLGELPEGYDHKYIYSEIGYNLKPLELQAAMGMQQLKKLDGFVEARKRNFRILTEALQPVKDRVILPEATPNSDPSWFAYPMTLADGIDRKEVVAKMEERRIATRMLFGANLLRQPAYVGRGLGDAQDYPQADRVMNQTFFVGTSPVVTEEMAHYVGASLREILEGLR